MPWFLENTGGGKEASYLSLTVCCSETGSQMAQAGSETAVYLRMTSNSWPSCFHIRVAVIAVITGVDTRA